MSKVITDKFLVAEVLTRSVSIVYPSPEALEKELTSGRQLRIYLGIDPTSPHLHLGHAASLWTLRRFQNLGHEIILLAGDFTAQIGDPTDKMAPRQPIKSGEIKKNMRTFKRQASRIISFSGMNPAKVRYNSEWYKKMKLEKFMTDLLGYFSVANLLHRKGFKERIEKDKLQLQEFIYPLLQGYDGVAMDVDMEIGGNDQVFNMNIGRALRKAHSKREGGRKEEKFFLATALLVDPISGKKLSKTEGSLVNLDDEPQDMFGRVMAMPDEMIPHVAELSTNMSMEAIRKLQREKNPRDAKLALALEVVKTYHSAAAAKKAREVWEKLFSKKEISLSTNLPVLEVHPRERLYDAIVRSKVVSTKSTARRLIKQRSVSVNNLPPVLNVLAGCQFLQDGDVVKIGKKNFFRIKIV